MTHRQERHVSTRNREPTSNRTGLHHESGTAAMLGRSQGCLTQSNPRHARNAAIKCTSHWWCRALPVMRRSSASDPELAAMCSRWPTRRASSRRRNLCCWPTRTCRDVRFSGIMAQTPDFCAVHGSGSVQGFGCRPCVTGPRACGPASESRQGTNPRAMVRGRRRALCYGDLADGQVASHRALCALRRSITWLADNNRTE